MKRVRVIIGVGVLLLLLASVAVTWLQPLSRGWSAVPPRSAGPRLL
jgi:hypothetical protein